MGKSQPSSPSPAKSPKSAKSVKTTTSTTVKSPGQTDWAKFPCKKCARHPNQTPNPIKAHKFADTTHLPMKQKGLCIPCAYRIRLGPCAEEKDEYNASGVTSCRQLLQGTREPNFVGGDGGGGAWDGARDG